MSLLDQKPEDQDKDKPQVGDDPPPKDDAPKDDPPPKEDPVSETHELAVPEGGVEGLSEDEAKEAVKEFGESAVYDRLRARARDLGLPPKDFEALALDVMSAGLAEENVDATKEMEKLGSNAKEIINRVSTWADNSFTKEEAAMIKGLGVSAEMVKLLDKIRDVNSKGSSTTVGRESSQARESAADEYNRLMASEAANDPGHERYDATQKRILELAQRLGDQS